MKTALLVIDAQNIYTDQDSEMYCQDSSATLERINKLIVLFKDKNLPVVYVRHIHKSDGSDLGRLFDYSGEFEGEFNFLEGTTEVEFDDRLIIDKNDPQIVKNRYSAFKNTKLEKLLSKLNIRRITICGFMTNFCCESTAREALDLDYYVDFIVDATGSPGTERYGEEEIRVIVSELLQSGFARVFKASDYMI